MLIRGVIADYYVNLICKNRMTECLLWSGFVWLKTMSSDYLLNLEISCRVVQSVQCELIYIFIGIMEYIELRICWCS